MDWTGCWIGRRVLVGSRFRAVSERGFSRSVGWVRRRSWGCLTGRAGRWPTTSSERMVCGSRTLMWPGCGVNTGCDRIG